MDAMSARTAVILSEGAEAVSKFANECYGFVASAATLVAGCLHRGGKVLLCGNGGSAAQATHLAAEFTGRFKRERRGLPAISLATDTSALTAIGNDYGFHRVFARQVEALAHSGDVLIALSTSGSSGNVIDAVLAARHRDVLCVGLTGRAGGQLAGMCEVCVRVPADDAATVQVCHLIAGHAICELVEASLA